MNDVFESPQQEENEITSTEPLIEAHANLEPQQSQEPPRTWKSIYVLIVFILISCFQCMSWFSIAAHPTSSYKNLQINSQTLNFLLDCGPLCFLILAFPAMFLLTLKSGLNFALIVSSSFSFIGNLVRLVPTLLKQQPMPSQSSETFSSSSSFYPNSISMIGKILLFIGQIFISSSGPVIVSAVTLLSFTWFSGKGRTTATMLAYQSSNLGFAISFILVPLILYISSFHQMLISICVLASIPLLLSIIYIPKSAISAQNSMVNTQIKFLPGFLQCMKSKGMILCMIAGGIQNGVFGAWISVLPQSLKALGFNPIISGWLGFSCSISCIPASIFVGRIADHWMKNNLKRLAIYLWIFTLISFIWLSIAFMFGIRNIVICSISLICVGLFQGSLIPLFFEISAEITQLQGTSAGLITLTNNCFSFLFLAFSDKLSVNVFNLIMIVIFSICTISTFLIDQSEKPQNIVHTTVANEKTTAKPSEK